MFHKIFRWLPLEVALFSFSFSPPMVHPAENNLFYVGTGNGQSIVQGDVDHTIDTSMMTLGTQFATEDWVFLIDSAGAKDNRMLNVRLLAEYGNDYIKFGTGFIGTESSVPTQPGTVAGFYQAATSVDTRVSATTIPLAVRIIPYTSPDLYVSFDAYYGLYSNGSMRIPIETIIPGRPAYLITEPQRTGGTYGAQVSAGYRMTDDMGLQLSVAQQHGRMDSKTVRIDGDPLGITLPVQTPALSFRNRTVLLTLVLFAD
jgi:hypothetical protein